MNSELRIPRRRLGQPVNRTPTETIEAVRILAQICSDKLTAGLLTRNGLRTGHGNRWTRERVTSLRSCHKIPPNFPQRQLSEGWVNLNNAAQSLGVAARTLRLAVERGEIEAQHPLADGSWMFSQQALHTAAAADVVERARRRTTKPAAPKAGPRTLDFSTT